MKVILIKDVDAVGRIGDTVDVARGYAHNYLIPGKHAVAATQRSLKQLNHQKRLAQSRLRKEVGAAESLKRKIESIQITIPAKVGEDDKLYGSITNKNIQEALAASGVEVDRRNIQLEEPIRSAGAHQAVVKLGYQVEAQAKIWVVKEEE